MAIKFYKLMDVLARKEMSKGELQKRTGISSATLAKLSNNEYVALAVIDKICQALECQPGDIMEFIPDKQD